MQDDTAHIPTDTWSDSPLRPSLERFAALHTRADVRWGHPEESDDGYRYEALYDPGFIGRFLDQIAAEFAGPPAFSGTRLFRVAHFLPLRLAGYLFAAEGRVIRLRENLVLRKAAHRHGSHPHGHHPHGGHPHGGRPPGLRVLEPRAVVLPDDPAAGAPGIETAPDRAALADALFAEVTALAEPLMRRLHDLGVLPPGTGWGILLDFLAAGFLAAGRAGTGLDAAWAAWEEAIAGRTFPARRLPRRLQFTADGRTEEIMVHAHCCLRYALPHMKDREDRHCIECYLESDENRIARLLERRIAGAHVH